MVSVAPGLGQPRPKRQGEARGLHLYEIEDDCLRIQTYVWRDTDWGLTAERRFPRGREPLGSNRWPKPSREGGLGPRTERSDECNEDYRDDDADDERQPSTRDGAATSRETMPIAMVSSQPMGSDPGWKSRPSAPTIAPTMMNQMKCMRGGFPPDPRRKPQFLGSAAGLGPFGLELLVGEDPALWRSLSF